MKTFLYLVLLAMTFTGCKCQKTNSANTPNANALQMDSNTQKNMPVIEYEANSRGYYLRVKVENKRMFVSRNRDNQKDVKEVALSEADWNELVRLTKMIQPESLQNLKAPTDQRLYDGAPHANITFITNENQFTTPGFDHGFPPKEIEQLVTKIIVLAENIK